MRSSQDPLYAAVLTRASARRPATHRRRERRPRHRCQGRKGVVRVRAHPLSSPCCDYAPSCAVCWNLCGTYVQAFAVLRRSIEARNMRRLGLLHFLILANSASLLHNQEQLKGSAAAANRGDFASPPSANLVAAPHSVLRTGATAPSCARPALLSPCSCACHVSKARAKGCPSTKRCFPAPTSSTSHRRSGSRSTRAKSSSAHCSSAWRRCLYSSGHARRLTFRLDPSRAFSCDLFNSVRL